MSRGQEPQAETQLGTDEPTYPPQAFDFVQDGLSFTVERIHGQPTEPNQNRHVSGQQLCMGLRDYALQRWGRMARTVLRRWNINTTLDFGQIVFELVALQKLKTTEQDSLEDFRDVFDFHAAFETGYRIEHKT
jgi:uncharacterized repeat protein (TIGR04138 family)